MLAGLFFDLPALGRADIGGAVGFTLEEECGAVAELGEGGEDAEIPDRRGDQVVAGFQEWREVEALIAPVGDVSTGGTIADARAVHEKNEAIVGADADGVARG